MSDKQPTEAQIKKFLQWCGIQCYYKDWANDDIEAWICPPDGEKTVAFRGIDLNFLFKYAVPKLRDLGEIAFCCVAKGWRVFIIPDSRVKIPHTKSCHSEGIYDDPALALFWAIWEVINE